MYEAAKKLEDGQEADKREDVCSTDSESSKEPNLLDKEGAENTSEEDADADKQKLTDNEVER